MEFYQQQSNRGTPNDDTLWDISRYTTQLRNSEVYGNEGIGVFVTTGSIFVINSKIFGNGNHQESSSVYDSAGFYSTSFTKSTIAYNSVIRGNRGSDIHCRGDKWPNFGPFTSDGFYFPSVGFGNTNPDVSLFPHQYYFRAFGSFTPPIYSHHVHVPTSDPSRFYPSLSSFALSSSNYHTDPLVWDARLIYMEALTRMYDAEYEDAYAGLKDFIAHYYHLSELRDEVQSALTLMPFLDSAIGGDTQELVEFIEGLDAEVFDKYLKYALLKVDIMDEKYHEAMRNAHHQFPS
jgi:hypothetical protein